MAFAFVLGEINSPEIALLFDRLHPGLDFGGGELLDPDHTKVGFLGATLQGDDLVRLEFSAQTANPGPDVGEIKSMGEVSGAGDRHLYR